MTVEITVEHKSSLLVNLLDQALCVEDGRMQCLVWRLPSSVKITSCQTTPIVPVDDTIGVEHRHDLEYEILTQHSSLDVVRIGQESQHTAHHPRAHRLTRVHSGRDYHALSLPKVL